MFTIAIIGQKGGTGKTTLAVGLAGVAAEAGQDVALLDLDPQTNAANWKDRRTAENPAVLPTPIGRLRQALDACGEAHADLVIIDTPGKSDSTAMAAAKVADVVLVPCDFQIYQLETLESTRELIALSGNPPAFVVLNGLHPSATRLAEQAKALTAQQSGMKVCPVYLSKFDVHRTAPDTGLAPNEAEPHSRASDELRQLYKFISALSDRSESEPNGQQAIKPAKRA